MVDGISNNGVYNDPNNYINNDDVDGKDEGYSREQISDIISSLIHKHMTAGTTSEFLESDLGQKLLDDFSTDQKETLATNLYNELMSDDESVLDFISGTDGEDGAIFDLLTSDQKADLQDKLKTELLDSNTDLTTVLNGENVDDVFEFLTDDQVTAVQDELYSQLEDKYGKNDTAGNWADFATSDDVAVFDLLSDTQKSAIADRLYHNIRDPYKGNKRDRALKKFIKNGKGTHILNHCTGGNSGKNLKRVQKQVKKVLEGLEDKNLAQHLEGNDFSSTYQLLSDTQKTDFNDQLLKDIKDLSSDGTLLTYLESSDGQSMLSNLADEQKAVVADALVGELADAGTLSDYIANSENSSDIILDYLDDTGKSDLSDDLYAELQTKDLTDLFAVDGSKDKVYSYLLDDSYKTAIDDLIAREEDWEGKYQGKEEDILTKWHDLPDTGTPDTDTESTGETDTGGASLQGSSGEDPAVETSYETTEYQNTESSDDDVTNSYNTITNNNYFYYNVVDIDTEYNEASQGTTDSSPSGTVPDNPPGPHPDSQNAGGSVGENSKDGQPEITDDSGDDYVVTDHNDYDSTSEDPVSAKFNVDSSGVDRMEVGGNQTSIEYAFMFLLLERAENLTETLEDLGQEIKNKNNEVAFNNDTIAHIRENEDKGSLTDEQIAYYEDKGYSISSTWEDDTDSASIIETLQEKNNSLNSESQFDMITTQATMKNLNMSIEMASNTISSQATLRKTLAGNIKN